jgi:arsenate reductase (thioredoxin)
MQVKILILCTGNSCRSQMAHGFLQSFDPNITVCSAGTKASEKLNRKAVEVMKEVGVDISHHTSDPVEKYLDEEWDYVITVCGGANETCPAFSPDNGAHMGLVDAHDPVPDTVGTVVVHLFLLFIQGLYHQKIFVLSGAQRDFRVRTEQPVD